MYDTCDRCRQELAWEHGNPPGQSVLVICMNCGFENTRVLQPSEAAVVGPDETATLQPAQETAVLRAHEMRRRRRKK
jgi:hypothetical protein